VSLLLSRTRSRAFRKCDLKPFKIIAAFCATDPALSVECVRVWEDAGILEDKGDAHADGCLKIVSIEI
jgi:hypothetical protein